MSITEKDLADAGLKRIADSNFYIASEETRGDKYNAIFYYMDNGEPSGIDFPELRLSKDSLEKIAYYPRLDAIYIDSGILLSKNGSMFEGKFVRIDGFTAFRKNLNCDLFKVSLPNYMYNLIIVKKTGDGEYKWAYIFPENGLFIYSLERPGHICMDILGKDASGMDVSYQYIFSIHEKRVTHKNLWKSGTLLKEIRL